MGSGGKDLQSDFSFQRHVVFKISAMRRTLSESSAVGNEASFPYKFKSAQCSHCLHCCKFTIIFCALGDVHALCHQRQLSFMVQRVSSGVKTLKVWSLCPV